MHRTFHIALTGKLNLQIKQNIVKIVNFLFYYRPLTQKILRVSKHDKTLQLSNYKQVFLNEKTISLLQIK